VVLDAAEDGHADQIGAFFADSSATAESSPGKHTQLALTVNAGVALIGLAWEALLVHGPQYGLPPATLLALGQLLTTRWATICAAQQRDLTAGRTPDLPLEDYEQIITGKAGEIGGVTTEAGAILAGAERWRGLWHTVGMERTILQQLADDAKDLAQDLAEGQQLSHAVRYGLAVANAPQKTQLLDLLRQVQDPPSPAARQRLVQLLEELGAVQYVLVQMEIHRQRALTALAALPLPETAATWFRAWIEAAGRPAFGDNAPLGEA
jgi:geranylgeranyl pyrophosphate synthase